MPGERHIAPADVWGCRGAGPQLPHVQKCAYVKACIYARGECARVCQTRPRGSGSAVAKQLTLLSDRLTDFFFFSQTNSKDVHQNFSHAASGGKKESEEAEKVGKDVG